MLLTFRMVWLQDLLEESAAWPALARGLDNDAAAGGDGAAEQQLDALRRALLAEQAHAADLQVQVLSAA